MQNLGPTPELLIGSCDLACRESWGDLAESGAD